MVEAQNADVKLVRDELRRELLDELARIHTLIDQVSAELSLLICDDCAEALQILDKNSESQVLQAYYKGLRYVYDRHTQDGHQREQFADRS